MSDRRLQGPQSVWLVRHGESAGNVARDAAYAQGLDRIDIAARRDVDVPLSVRGEEQSRALGRWIAGLPPEERPTAVVSSPYLRARNTAELALQAAGLGALPLDVDERLREREFGILDRLTKSGIEKLYPDQAALRRAIGKFYYRPPGGESWTDVILRLRSFLNTSFHSYRGERLLVVCHSAVVLCFRYVLEGLSEAQILEIDKQCDVANCSVTSYVLQPGHTRMELRRFNFVAPLEQQGAPVTTSPDVPVAAK